MLLLVLVVVALLSALLGDFAFSTLVDLRLTESFRDRTKAYYLAKGGVRFGRMLLQEDTNTYDSLDDLWAQPINHYPVGDGAVSILIEDHDGRLNLNRLVTGQGNIDVVIRDRLLRLFQHLDIAEGPELTAALIDWIDPDDEPQPLGAESDYYLSLPDPYRAKNAPLDTMEEMLRVRGFSPRLLQRLAPYVTLYGDRRVNVNTAPGELLMALAEEMDGRAVDAVLNARQRSPLTSLTQLRDLPELERAYGFIFRYVKFDSSCYRVTARAEVGSGRSLVKADIRKDDNQVLYFKVD